jgi:uncharacterized membrane protein YgdD (TMEM256/DUF423 family)
MNDKKLWLIISAVSGFTAVAIGAFGAHGFREMLSPEMLEIFKTGVFYQFIHTIVLLILSLTNFIKSHIASMFFLAGIILFSFSLYLYSTTGMKFFAMITPIGGVCFLIGWFWLIIEAIRMKASS